MKKLLKQYKALSITVKASMWFMLCSVIQKGIGFITTPIFTRILTTEEYGQYCVFLSWQGIISIFATMQLFYGVFNTGMTKFDNDKDGFTSSLQGLVTTITAAWIVIIVVFNKFFTTLFDMPLYLILLMLVEVLFVATVSLWSGRQRYDYRYKSMVCITLGISLMNPTIGVIFCLAAENRGVARIISAVLTETIFGIVLYIVNLVRGKKFYDKTYWKYAFLFNLPLIPHYLSQTALSQSDRLMINAFCGASYAGMYSVAYSLSQVLNIVTNSINNAFVPWQYRCMKSGEFQRISKVANSMISILAILLVVFIGVAPELMKLISTSAYYEGVWAIPPLCMSLFFSFLYTLFANVEFYYEKRRYVLFASMCSAIINIILNYIFINMYGFIAAGYTTLFCFIIYVFLHYFFMKKTLKENGVTDEVYSVKFILKYVFYMIAASVILMFLYDTIIPRDFLLIVVSVLMLFLNRNILGIIKGMKI